MTKGIKGFQRGHTINLGRIYSEERRRKISETRIRTGVAAGSRHPNWGKHLSEETREKIRLSHLGPKNPNYGKGWTAERTFRQSTIMKKLYREGRMKPHMLGKHHSEETKKKISRPGKLSATWKGGKIIENGYTKIKIPNHPHSHKGYVSEHRLVAEKALRRYLKPGEKIHHINGNKLDNRNSNLLICSNSYHRWLHEQMARAYMKEHFS